MLLAMFFSIIAIPESQQAVCFLASETTPRLLVQKRNVIAIVLLSFICNSSFQIFCFGFFVFSPVLIQSCTLPFSIIKVIVSPDLWVVQSLKVSHSLFPCILLLISKYFVNPAFSRYPFGIP